ncbi:MAG: hypothetical protein JXQ23_02640 [Clostridia bacterium]|nr:hypothetical protein [Clostridia bacterium]
MRIIYLKKMLKNEKGGASVLVVVFLLVLIILSLTALMTSVSNEKLTDKTKVWISDYYVLDKIANMTYIKIIEDGPEAYVNRTENGIQYIDYIAYDADIKDKWVEVTLQVDNKKVTVLKWMEVQKPFVIDDSITYFDGKFED